MKDNHICCVWCYDYFFVGLLASWSQWTSWSTCSRCTESEQSRLRDCVPHPDANRSLAVCDNTVNESFETRPCVLPTSGATTTAAGKRLYRLRTGVILRALKSSLNAAARWYRASPIFKALSFSNLTCHKGLRNTSYVTGIPS